MKTVDIQGITHIEPVPDGTSEWYYGISYEHGDLYEAEEVFRAGETVKGNTVCLIHYPELSGWRGLLAGSEEDRDLFGKAGLPG